MASIGEIMAEAEVVTHETTVMYDHELLSEMKCLTVEELYVRLVKELDVIDLIQLKESYPTNVSEEDSHQGRVKQLSNKEEILGYLCELYRRHILVYGIGWVDYDIVLCKEQAHHEMGPEDLRCSATCCDKHRRTDIPIPIPILSKKESMCLHERTVSQQYWTGFQTIKTQAIIQLKKMRKIKELHLACVKQPLIYEEINDLMDSILDCNGNKISEFKEYLTPEHYRLIRSGVDVKEMKEPDVLLQCLRRMKQNKIEKI